MPELPEVETIRRGLKKFIKLKKLYKVTVLCEKSFRGGVSAVEGRKVVDIKRRGKAMIIVFDNDYTLLIHLRMTGQMIWVGEQRYAGGHPSENFEAELPNKQTRVMLKFEDGTLYFNDQRKFGFMMVMKVDEVEQDKFIAGLGPEPWEMERGELYKVLQRHGRAPAKAVLLNQKLIAGLGNIYADECCHYAGVLPMRLAGEVSEKEAELLTEGARVVMEAAIKAGGSTMETYRKADGSKGDYLELFAKVFNREGKKCERCGEVIVKTRCAGRGTHYCPGCQK